MSCPIQKNLVKQAVPRDTTFQGTWHVSSGGLNVFQTWDPPAIPGHKLYISKRSNSPLHAGMWQVTVPQCTLRGIPALFGSGTTYRLPVSRVISCLGGDALPRLTTVHHPYVVYFRKNSNKDNLQGIRKTLGRP